LEEAAKAGDEREAKTRTPIPVRIPGLNHADTTIHLGPREVRWASTESTPWFVWTLRGFGFSGSVSEAVQIRTLRIAGSRNLLWHEEWVQLSAYLSSPLNPRDSVMVTAPNYAEFELRNAGDTPVAFNLWVLGEPVTDTRGG